MEDRLAPISADVKKIRELINALELCHHKAERWVANIIEAIGTGETSKGLGTRSRVHLHPAETVWQNACECLSAWIAGCPVASIDLSIDSIPASQILAGLGERSPLKEWQVQRVIGKIRSSIHWPHLLGDPAAAYVWILLSGTEYAPACRDSCPEQYKEHEDFWIRTVQTIIHDAVNGDDAELSLGLAIDMLWPCHWNFVGNLQIVLDAIGGQLNPERVFASCGRNITPLPIQSRLMVMSEALRDFFSGSSDASQQIDTPLLAHLVR